MIAVVLQRGSIEPLSFLYFLRQDYSSLVELKKRGDPEPKYCR